MNRRNFLKGGVILAVSAAVTTTAVQSDSDVSPHLVSIHRPSAHEWGMLQNINSYRVSRGLKRLEMSRSLAAAAHHHSYYMSRTDDVDHSLDVDWTRNIYNYGYPAGGALGEVVAAGRSSASGTLQQWKDSPGHNNAILSSNYIRMGAGRVAYGSGKYDYYWCVTLGGLSHRTIYQ